MENSKISAVTVRELGGEFWAEIRGLPTDVLSVATSGAIVDTLMGVLARHVGERIENDEDLPVEPLPKARSE